MSLGVSIQRDQKWILINQFWIDDAKFCEKRCTFILCVLKSGVLVQRVQIKKPLISYVAN